MLHVMCFLDCIDVKYMKLIRFFCYCTQNYRLEAHDLLKNVPEDEPTFEESQTKNMTSLGYLQIIQMFWGL